MFNRPDPKPTRLSCPACSGRLALDRLCTRAVLRCKSCGATYPLESFTDMMDEDWEEFYAGVPLDRM
jgi:transcription elongation factor Elf1